MLIVFAIRAVRCIQYIRLYGVNYNFTLVCLIISRVLDSLNILLFKISRYIFLSEAKCIPNKNYGGTRDVGYCDL